MVAFLDILGQKEAFEGVNGIPETDEQKEQLTNALKHTVGFVEHFRSWFNIFFDQVSQPINFQDIVPAEWLEHASQMSSSKIITKHFSDSLVVFIPLQTDTHHCSNVNSIYAALSACGAMFLLALFCKHAVRGGIEIGAGCTLESGEIYGPALNMAYHLESSVAQHPRIVVGGKLINYLLQRVNEKISNEFSEYCRSRARMCHSMIMEGHDGFPELNYLGDEFHELFAVLKKPIGGKEPHVKEIITGAAEFIRFEKQRHIMRGDHKLAGRYSLLERYFIPRASKWLTESKGLKGPEPNVVGGNPTGSGSK
jgi:hypothetical protein